MTSLRDLVDKDYAEGWKPEAGDYLEGEIIEISKRDGGYGDYPIITVRQDDGNELAWHASPTIAKAQVADKQPNVGDRIGILYKGKLPKKSDPKVEQHVYRVVVERGATPLRRAVEASGDNPF
jgi:hypothetical protein